jgi:sigma54-dependent transcription regulator
LDWELTIEDVSILLAQQGGRCALSGSCLVTRGAFKEITASIDRIDSLKGYTMGNVQLVHKDINMMKQAFEQSYFISLCQKVAGNNK